MASSQIMQRTIVREKLKVQQPDIYIDVEVDEYYVLDFHRFRQILAAAAPAKEQLRRQLDRVLASQTLETLPATAVAALELPDARPSLAPQAAAPEPQDGFRRRARDESCARRARARPDRTSASALALGGGSARGLAHVLMLEAFDELGVKPAVIAGTSMGAIIGAAYAAGLSGAEMRAQFMALFASRAKFLKHFTGKLRGGISTLWSPRAPSVIDNVTLFEMLLPEAMRCDFASLKIPFLAIAADFYAIEQVMLDTGPTDPGVGGELGAAEPHQARGSGWARHGRRRLRQPGALRRDSGPRRRDGCHRRHRRHPAPARRNGPAHPRRHHRIDPAAVPLDNPREAQVGGARYPDPSGGR